jgi:hypothetical protein
MESNYLINTRIEEIAKVFPTSRNRVTEFGTCTGPYPFFINGKNHSFTRSRCETNDYPYECLLLSACLTATTSVIRCSNFSCDKNTIVIKCNNENATEYVYQYLVRNIDILVLEYVDYTGTGFYITKNLKIDVVKNIIVTIPDLEKIERVNKRTDEIRRIRIARMFINNTCLYNNVVNYILEF